MHVYSKDDRPNRWVIFERQENGTLARLYSTTRKPVGMKRIPWPITYAASGSIIDMIRVTSQP